MDYENILSSVQSVLEFCYGNSPKCINKCVWMQDFIRTSLMPFVWVYRRNNHFSSENASVCLCEFSLKGWTQNVGINYNTIT
jgi:hypothetical protein